MAGVASADLKDRLGNPEATSVVGRDTKKIDSRPKVPRLYADGRLRWPAINVRENDMYSRSGGVGIIGVIVIVVVILFLVGVIKL